MEEVCDPAISVIIPVYNRVAELRRALSSVLAQTFPNYEVLVVDDGSEEDIQGVCTDMEDGRIQYIPLENHTNANVARNAGIQKAKGQYIAMLDSDDEWLPGHLERRINKIEKGGCDAIVGSAIIRSDTMEQEKISRPIYTCEKMVNYLLSDGFAPTPSHFYRASAAKMIGWDETLERHQDYDFMVRFSKKFLVKTDSYPSVIINYTNRKHFTLEQKHFSSIKKFIEQNYDDIQPTVLIKHITRLTGTLRQSGLDIAVCWCKALLVKNIAYASIADFMSVECPCNLRMRLSARLRFSFLVLCRH